MKDFIPHVFPTLSSNGQVYCWQYSLAPNHVSSPYRTEVGAKAQMTKHLRRGGLSPEWFRRRQGNKH